jgi:hypothetical protein
MDPNTALENCRKAIREGDAELLGTSFDALDGWLMKGGFLPKDWQDAHDADVRAIQAALNRNTTSEAGE